MVPPPNKQTAGKSYIIKGGDVITRWSSGIFRRGLNTAVRESDTSVRGEKKTSEKEKEGQPLSGRGTWYLTTKQRDRYRWEKGEDLRDCGRPRVKCSHGAPSKRAGPATVGRFYRTRVPHGWGEFLRAYSLTRKRAVHLI